jgi:hypothetical protein
MYDDDALNKQSRQQTAENQQQKQNHRRHTSKLQPEVPSQYQEFAMYM